MKTKVDYMIYIKLFLVMFLIFPLEVTYWCLDFEVGKALMIAGLTHCSIFVLFVFVLNYLESGNPFESIKQ